MSSATSLRRVFVALATLLAVTLFATGCGGSGSTESSEASESSSASETSASDSASSSDSVSDVPEATAEFPLTIEHKYGSTTLDEVPQRVVSVGFTEGDDILALGVVPIGIRDWYGEQPFATWPWAQDELGSAEPAVLASAELNFEQIAALEPDVIIGVSSGMSEEDYGTLSAIAPTVAQPGEYPDYGTPWREQFAIVAEALGRSDLGEEILADIEERFAAVREEHPEFDGQTAAVAFSFNDLPGAYSSADPRSQLLEEMGFVIPEEFDELAGDSFYFSVSQEEIATLDTDVLVWILGDETGYQAVSSMPLRPSLRAYEEGREVVTDPLLAGAFSFASPLSIDYLLDNLVPDLALAVDGDPSTVVGSVALLEDGTPIDGDSGSDDGDGGLSDDEQAAADAWAVVFDSESGFDEKAPHLEDAESLRGTIEAYGGAGSAMGGIALDPTSVLVDGESAAVTYDVLFGGNAAYSDLTGELSLVDGTWVVSRDEFCGFMASARTPCEATTGDASPVEYPVTIEHRLGETVIEERPERIVTLNVQWTDAVLAMGETPVAYMLSAVGGETEPYPWQDDLLGEAQEITTAGDIPFEEIAALQPDLILVTFATSSEDDFGTLAEIAPTIGLLGDLQVDPWVDQVEVLGQVLGDPGAAAEVIDGVDEQVGRLADDLPGLEGKTYTFANLVPGTGIFVIADPDDGASRVFNALGMELAPDIVALDEGAVGRIQISFEEVGLLQADLVGVLLNGQDFDSIVGLAELPSNEAGTLVDMELQDIVGLNTPSPLSIPYILELLRPTLELLAAGED